jgi:hypothetical protein
MIKARAHGETMDVVMLGLSRRNLETIETGRPLTFEGKCIEMPGVRFMLFFGETERGILEEFDKRGMLSQEWGGITPEQRAAAFADADRADAGLE